MTYDDTYQQDVEPAFEEFKKMKQDIVQLQKTVMILQNFARDAMNKWGSLEKTIDAHSDHLRTISRAMAVRPMQRPPAQSPTHTPPEPQVVRRETRPMGAGTVPVREAPTAPPPPEYLVNTAIKEAEPIAPLEQSRKRK